jgi:hypothetical protein
MQVRYTTNGTFDRLRPERKRKKVAPSQGNEGQKDGQMRPPGAGMNLSFKNEPADAAPQVNLVYVCMLLSHTCTDLHTRARTHTFSVLILSSILFVATRG